MSGRQLGYIKTAIGDIIEISEEDYTRRLQARDIAIVSLVDYKSNPNEYLRQVMVQALSTFYGSLLNAEFLVHLGYEKSGNAKVYSDNRRNGYVKKSVRSSFGQLDILVPRDREGTFSPIAIRKHSRAVTSNDSKLMSIYAHALDEDQIATLLHKMYFRELTPDCIDIIKDRVISDVRFSQARRLRPLYSLVLLSRISFEPEKHLVTPDWAKTDATTGSHADQESTIPDDELNAPDSASASGAVSAAGAAGAGSAAGSSAAADAHRLAASESAERVATHSARASSSSASSSATASSAAASASSSAGAGAAKDGGSASDSEWAKNSIFVVQGLDCKGNKEILEIFFSPPCPNASAYTLLESLKNRGVDDIMMVVTDGLPLTAAALKEVFPFAVLCNDIASAKDLLDSGPLPKNDDELDAILKDSAPST